MRVMKVLTVLGLLLAISVPASALSWNATGSGYKGAINLQFDFVTSSGFDGLGRPISWGIYKVDSVFRSDTNELIWQDTADGLAQGIELSGILYKLHDDAAQDVTLGQSGFNLFGNGLELDLYENPRSSYSTARSAGTGPWGGPGSEGVFTGLTDNGPVALAGVGTPIIIVPPSLPPFLPMTDLTGGGLIALAEQKTFLNIVDTNGVMGIWPFPLPNLNPLELGDLTTAGIVGGSSTAYLNWTGGYLLGPGPGTIVDSLPVAWAAIDPVAAQELVPGALSNARTTQTFSSTGVVGGAAADPVLNGLGWEFYATGNKGNLDTMAIIPEPLTMIALFGGIAGLGGYIRKRRMA